MAIRILIVDDSYVVRRVLEEGLHRHSDIEVMAAVADPLFAMEKMEMDWPDVLVLDVEMPRMDGITFLKQIMSTRPTPVVICSSLVQAGADIAVQALQAGAFAIIPKPRLGVRDFLENAADDLAGIIRAAAASRIQHLVPAMRGLTETVASTKTGKTGSARLVAIGSSTGGTQALEMILQTLPRTCPGIVAVQHMHPELLSVFAETLNRTLSLNVKVAQTGDRIAAGWVYLAPGERHLTVERDDAGWRCVVKEGPMVSKHCPSVDVLFRSVAKEAGPDASGFVLTGMGEDGARGLKEMRDAGAATYAQDEESCVVFGMSKEAIKLGAVQKVVSLGDIPDIIAGWAS